MECVPVLVGAAAAVGVAVANACIHGLAHADPFVKRSAMAAVLCTLQYQPQLLQGRCAASQC